MAQRTTPAFAHRLQQALDASPHVVPMSYGRLSWLKRELEADTRLDIMLRQ